ncbi:MAG: alpha/beta hydrolase [Clostridiales bacterium]|nr:alpha/beta hydrolase [Clostridiales bacterium]
MFFKRIGAFFMAIVSFFNILFAGYIKYYPHNRIFLDEYYTEAKNKRQTYDLVIPKNASGSTGLILCIHGGGWVGGSKDSYTANLMQVSEHNGFAAAAVNYRYVSDSVNYADLMDDISSALAAIKAKGAEYGVNFDKALLTGISAGGHLSLLYAYTRKDSAPIEPVCVVELCGPADLEHEFYYSDENSISQAVGGEFFRGIISDGVDYEISMVDFDAARPALKKYSPINFVDKDTVPTVFGHGEQDEIVPYQNAVDLDAKLTQFNVEHTFVSFPNSGHGCEDKDSMAKIMELFFSYADKYLK